MKLKLFIACGVGLSLLAIGFTGQSILASSSVELWYMHHCYLATDADIQKSKSLIDKAAAAGYTGAMIWDSNVSLVGLNGAADPDREDRLKEVMKYARRKHLKTVAETAPFGWSGDVLHYDPNWAESQPVVGARFEVSADGKSLRLKSSLAPLVNGDFASGPTGWFDLNDAGVKIDPTAHEGGPAVSIVDPGGNARIRQRVAVQPWHQYHLSVSYRFEGSRPGLQMVTVYDSSNFDKIRLIADLSPVRRWMDLSYVFNSRDSQEVWLYMGVWGGQKGTMQIASVSLEETALVWVSHRNGAPFKLYDPEDSSKVYAPGVDYDEVVDPEMAPLRGFESNYHEPPAFTLPSGTKLKPKQIVAADYYAVTPLADNRQASLCLTEPGVFAYLAKNAQRLRKAIPQEGGVLLAYDELRQANSCFSCRAKNMTAGELLAWNFDETFGIYRQAMPDAPIWVWSDMFDPFHNARDNYFLVEGTLAGSWKGLPSEVTILNWNLDKLKNSLTWFSGKNPEQPMAHPQIIAGFYDHGDAAAEVRREIGEANGIPNIHGVMYTTWTDDYSQLQAFADAARAAWPDYLKSVPAPSQ